MANTILRTSRIITPRVGLRPFRIVLRRMAEGAPFAVHDAYTDSLGGFGRGDYATTENEAASHFVRRCMQADEEHPS